MSFAALASLSLLGAVTQAAHTQDLGRLFMKGEKIAYQVRSHITAENRMKNLDTWIPQDLDLNYNFTTQVTDMHPDGIAVLHYQRPTMTEIQGETFNSAPVTKTHNLDLDYLLTVSPINQILSEKDISKHPDHGGEVGGEWATFAGQGGAQAFFAPFIGDIHRLALFIGGVQDSLDFSPKLPFKAVKVGDTWAATVGFEPQKLKDKEGKSAVQRLDYTYTYQGPVDEDGHKFLRVEAKLSFSTDLADFFKQALKEHADETNVDKIPLHFDSTIDFDLDPTTHETLRALGHTEGGYQVFLTDAGNDPAFEERFKGKTVMDEIGKRMVTSSPSK